MRAGACQAEDYLVGNPLMYGEPAEEPGCRNDEQQADCLLYGSPENPGEVFEFEVPIEKSKKQRVQGCGDRCLGWGEDTPVDTTDNDNKQDQNGTAGR